MEIVRSWREGSELHVVVSEDGRETEQVFMADTLHEAWWLFLATVPVMPEAMMGMANQWL